MRDISSPLDGIASPFGPQRTKTLTQLLFASSEPGFTFEPWDITTLYQDRAGTTPVTAAGQTIGLRLDKSKGLVLGPELISNGTFDSGTTGWTPQDANVVLSTSGGAGVATYSATSTFVQAISVQAGKTYRATAIIKRDSGSGTPYMNFRDGPSLNNSSIGQFSQTGYTSASYAPASAWFVAASTGTVYLHFPCVAVASTVVSIDNISVRELPGNHQVAVSDAKRGVYGWMPKTGRRNQLTYTEQFTFAHNSTTDIAYTGSLPTGTLAAREIREVAATNSHFFRIGSPTFNSSYTGALTFKIRVLPQGRTRVQVLPERVGASQWAGSTFNLVNNTATNTVVAGAQTLTSSNVVDAENGWKVITVTYTPTVSITGLLFCLLDDAVSGAAVAPSYAGDASKGVAITGMQIGPADTAYQRVVSQYDITEAGVPTCYYVQADGVDDAYVTPTITPNTDKVQVFAGVRKLSDATSIIAELSTAAESNNGTFNFFNNSTSRFVIFSRGTASSSTTEAQSSVLSAPVTSVLTGIGDISGDRATLRVNGTQVAQGTGDQGAGNYLASPIYIYARAGTSFPFNGLDFGHAVRFGPNLDAATIARVESLIARNTPEVTL